MCEVGKQVSRQCGEAHICAQYPGEAEWTSPDNEREGPGVNVYGRVSSRYYIPSQSVTDGRTAIAARYVCMYVCMYLG